MRIIHFAIIMATLALVIGCSNDRKTEKVVLQDTCLRQKTEKTWEDIQKQKDSLWEVYNESTDEEEVEKAKDLICEMGCMAEISALVGKEYEKYKARVEGEFQQLVSACPEYMDLFCKEKEKWESYHEAVLAMISLEDHGSSGTLNIIGALNQSVDLWAASFHNLLLYEQKQDIMISHTKFTSSMIDDAYKTFFNVATGDWYNAFTDDPNEGLEEYQAAITNERKMWDDWMGCRKIVAKSLPKDLRKVYDGCTNLMMRTKLHQLKNQNAGLGLMSSDVANCLLPDSCSDKALLEYPGLNVVLEKHCADLNWYPAFD